MLPILLLLQRKKLIKLGRVVEIPKKSLVLLSNEGIAEIVLRKCGKLLGIKKVFEYDITSLEGEIFNVLAKKCKINITDCVTSLEKQERIFREILNHRLKGLSPWRRKKLEKNLQALENEWETLGLLNNISATAAITAVGIAQINVGVATIQTLSILSSALGMTLSYGTYLGAASMTSFLLGPWGWSAVGLLWLGALVRRLYDKGKRLPLEVLVYCYQARLKLDLGQRLAHEIEQKLPEQAENTEKKQNLEVMQESNLAQLKEQFREEVIEEVLQEFIDDIQERDLEIKGMTSMIRSLQKEKDDVLRESTKTAEFNKLAVKLLHLPDSERKPEDKLIWPDHEPKIDRQFEYFLITMSNLPKVDRIIWARNLQTKSFTQIKEVKTDGEVKVYYTDRHQYAAKLRVLPVNCRDLTQAFYFADYLSRELGLPLDPKIYEGKESSEDD
jgi:hypothetical protein